MPIHWNAVSEEDVKLISKIVKRAVKMMPMFKRHRLDLTMDLTAAHLSCPLRLQDLLDADNFNFAHDVAGINQHLSRETGMLSDQFLPRFARKGKG